MADIQIIRTNATHDAFREMVSLLDKELAITDGDEHDYYHQYNQIDSIRFAVVAYLQQEPIGIGAIKPMADGVMEVKRMYVMPQQRGFGVAAHILQALEVWAAALGAHSVVLETGKRQPSAIALYEKCGYTRMPNYGQYAQMENSVCFKKSLA